MLFSYKTKEFTIDKVVIIFLSKNKLCKIKVLDLHHTLFLSHISHKVIEGKSLKIYKRDDI